MSSVRFQCSECMAEHVVPMEFAESCYEGEKIESAESVGRYMEKVLSRWHAAHPEERRNAN
jgi:hypothetical protein